MHTILVTGGRGMVGNALQQFARENQRPERQFVFVDIEDGDLRGYPATRALFEKHRPQGVIHLAANVGGLFKNLKLNVEMFEDNLLLNMNVLKVCHELGVEKLVSCLSTCIFPEPTLNPFLKLPIDEPTIHYGPPHPSNQGYAFAKRMLEVQSRLYRLQHGCNFVCVAPTNIFGQHDNFSEANSHVVPGLIRKCHAAVRDGTDFVVWGSGQPLRQFIYSRDLVRLFDWVYSNYSELEPLILAPPADHELSIGTIAGHIAQAFGYQKKIVFDTQYADGQFRRTVTNQKLMAKHPDFRFTPLAQALRETVDWYRLNHASARMQ